MSLYPKVNVPLLPSVPAGTQFVGRGFVWWWKTERHTGRYGSIWLSKTFESLKGPSSMYIRDLGSAGQLVAKLLDVGAFPLADYFATPRRVGQLVPLGEGRSFVADFGEAPLALGIKPTTGRKYNWLSPDCLHFVHTCCVDLLWVPRQRSKRPTRRPLSI
jgi:hypothetical protein